MEYVQMTIDDWVQMKQKLKQELLGVKQSFVRIGYALRKIEEQRLYEQDGYKSIAEFAKAEYGLEASTVSRFMSINREYSVDGYSETLRPEFADLGRSQLEEMLKLPDTDRQMIQPEASREDIRELKRFNKADPETGVADDITELVEKFFEQNPDTLNALYSSGAYTSGDTTKMAEIINPGGNRSFKKGLFFMMMYEDNIKIKKFGEPPRTMSWDAFFSITQGIFGKDAAGAETYRNHFGGKKDGTEQKRLDTGNDNTGNDKSSIQQDRRVGRSQETEDKGELAEGGEGRKRTETDTGAGTDGSGKEGMETSERTGKTGTDPKRADETEPQAETEAGKGTETGIAPAQKEEEEGIKEGTQKKETDENTTADVPESIEPEEAAGEKITETGSGTDQQEVMEKPFGSRKDYIDTLTAYGTAMYMAEEYKRHNLKASSLAYPSELEAWLLKEVDENGRGIEEE